MPPGHRPDARRYATLVVMTILATTGTFAAYTYITPFLIEVGRFPASATGPLLLVRGVAGVIGWPSAEPWPTAAPVAIVVPVLAQAVALLGLYAAGGTPAAALGLVALSGLSFSALTTALASRVLQVAPGSADLAAAGISTSVNVGITVGAWLGSILLPGFGVRSTVLAGGLLSLAAGAVALGPAGPGVVGSPDRQDRHAGRCPRVVGRRDRVPGELRGHGASCSGRRAYSDGRCRWRRALSAAVQPSGGTTAAQPVTKLMP